MLMSTIEKTNTVSMSSLRISELTKKNHKHVLRDIRNMLEVLEDEGPDLDRTGFQVIKQENNTTREILLNEELFMCLITGYSIPLRMMLINDWKRLKTEAGELKPKTNIISLLESALEELKGKAIIEERLVLAEPKVNYYNKVLSSEENLTTSVIATELGFKSATQLNSVLKEMGVIKKLQNQYVIRSKYAQQGYTSYKTHIVEKQDGEASSKTLMVWTQKGREFLHDLLKDYEHKPKVVKNAKEYVLSIPSTVTQ